MRRVDQLRMNLVADDKKVELDGQFGDAGEFGTGVDASGRVVRIDQDEHFRALGGERRPERLEVEPPPVLCVGEREFDRPAAHGRDGGEERRVVRSLDHDGVAALGVQVQDQLQGLDEIGLLPDVGGVDRPSVSGLHPPGELRTQRGTAEPIGVAEFSRPGRLAQRVPDLGGDREVHVGHPGRQGARADGTCPLDPGATDEIADLDIVESGIPGLRCRRQSGHRTVPERGSPEQSMQ